MNDTAVVLKNIADYKADLIKSINLTIGIEKNHGDDDYSVGVRNGLRIAKAFIDGEEPEYE